jgi:membrane fusion protein, multidrug efflux system
MQNWSSILMSPTGYSPAPAVSRRALSACLIGLALLLGGCSGSAEKGTPGPGGKSGKGAGKGDMVTPVLVAHAVRKDVPILAEVIGSVESSASVSIKPQISGQIIDAKFREGDFVTKGQLLVLIDPRALEAQSNQLQAQVAKDEAALGQAQANLARDRAQLDNARLQLERADQLVKGGIISKVQWDQYSTTAATYDATIQADLAAIENSKAQIAASRAAVENQKVQLGYTKMYAPITGRTGSMTVKPGNIVIANTTELAVINQVQPVYVTFALPEMHLAALRRASGQRLPVTAIPEGAGATQQTGTLAFFENTVDALTGTVKVKATFENHDRVLWPGQFVRVSLKLGERTGAVLVPSQAVQSGQEGTFAYVVKEDQKVEFRQITASQRLGDETVIDRGLEAGETVVTEGTLRLIPGARVSVRERGAGGRGSAPGGGAAPQGGAGGGNPEAAAPNASGQKAGRPDAAAEGPNAPAGNANPADGAGGKSGRRGKRPPAQQ